MWGGTEASSQWPHEGSGLSSPSPALDDGRLMRSPESAAPGLPKLKLDGVNVCCLKIEKFGVIF